MNINDIGLGCYKILFWMMLVLMAAFTLAAVSFMLEVKPYILGQ